MKIIDNYRNTAINSKKYLNGVVFDINDLNFTFAIRLKLCYNMYNEKIIKGIFKMSKVKKAVKITLIVLAIIIVLLIIAVIIGAKPMTVKVYDEFFGIRYESDRATMRYVEEFDGLEREKHVFESNNGQKLTGYVYSKGNDEAKGIIVFAHGFGGSHNSYMEDMDYFASNGYKVFGFDFTGNDESEGDCVEGLPQGVIDLDNALNYIAENEELSDLPVLLWGHSWGGYSVCTVSKLHPEIKGIISVAGFNESLDMLEVQGREITGDVIDFVLPLLKSHEKEKFGDFATMNALESLAESDADVMLIHCEDDNMIPIEISFDRYYEKFANDERFTFVRLKEGGHNELLRSENSLEYLKEYNKKANEYAEKVGAENYTEEERIKYAKENLDKSIYYEHNEELFTQMLEFYDSCVEK